MSNKQLKVLELNDGVRENLKKMYMILAGLQIIKFILWFVDTYVTKISVEQIGYTYDKSNSLFESWENTMFVNVLAIVLSIISIAVCVIPIYKNVLEKRIYSRVLVPILILSALHSLMYVMMSIENTIQNSNRFAQNYGEGMAEIYSGPNFFGFIQIAAIIISIVVTFNIYSKTKAISMGEKIKLYNENI